MNKEKFEFLTLRRFPSRLTAEETAWYMGFNLVDVTILTSAGLLKPLGKPAPNSIRFFARPELDQLSNDPKWLDRASAALGRHWRNRNERLTRKALPSTRKSRLEI